MKKTRTVTVLLITGLMIFAAASLIDAEIQLRGEEKITAELMLETESEERENEILTAQAESLYSDEAEKAFAESFFGLTDPHKIIFEDVN